MAQVNIRIDDNLKASADALFDELGLNMSTAVNMFVKQAVRQGGIPFPISTGGDPFFSEANQRRLRNAIANVESGRAKLTEHELIEADDD
jgi:DNA-damage-inducible protein J